MDRELVKQEALITTDGWSLWSTNDYDLAVMEWRQPEACELAHAIHTVVRRHALADSFVDRDGPHALIVKKLDLLPMQVLATGSQNDTVLEFLSASGSPLEADDPTAVDGVTPNRLDMINDTAIHTVRSMRAHLPQTDVALKLQFGIGPGGECLLQVINPLECDLGSTDYTALAHQLGGGRK